MSATSSVSAYAALRLKKNEERRIKGGHNWVFSNEVDVQHHPLSQFQPGQLVTLEDSRGQALGVGYINPHTLICARLLTRNPRAQISQKFFQDRLQQALSLRERLFSDPYYRWVYGDSDGLPGLVIDRYGNTVVIQASTAGMECLLDDIVAAIESCVDADLIILRNDSGSRDLEQLPKYCRVAKGEAADSLTILENAAEYSAPLLEGQKTGWFFDHRFNRAALRRYVKDQRVLDLFSYVGGWGIQAALAGAKSVTCADVSAKALNFATENARRNGVEKVFSIVEADAFELLKGLRAERERFDVVVLDPPAFIQKKKDLKNGETAYRRLNQAAMQVLSKEGILVSASCSSYLSGDTLTDIIRQSSRHIDRQAQILETGHQGPDHPVHPSIAETRYLKALFCRVIPTT